MLSLALHGKRIIQPQVGKPQSQNGNHSFNFNTPVLKEISLNCSYFSLFLEDHHSIREPEMKGWPNRARAKRFLTSDCLKTSSNFCLRRFKVTFGS